MRLRAGVRRRVGDFLGIQQGDSFHHLRHSVVELNDFHELKKVFGWSLDPDIGEESLYEYHDVVDVNSRRLRDAEALGTVVRNANPQVCLEIGTGRGYMTARLSMNAPSSKIYTINIPPESFAEGGTLTTMSLDESEIGAYYREKGCRNVTQILANSADWVPDIGTIDVAFIDGSHDTGFVVNDTRKVIGAMQPGSFILWHDFNLSLVHRYVWIRTVCEGVETLLRTGELRGDIYHVRDSWIGIYRVGGVAESQNNVTRV